MHRLDFLYTHLKGKKILDIGNLSRKGVVHAELMRRFPDAEHYGLDVVDQKEIGTNFPNQALGNAEAIPYPDDFFDAIYIGEVIEHTWKPKQVTDECYRVLRKGGMLIMDTPNIYSLSRMLRYIWKGKDIILGDPDHKIFFSKAVLEHMLENSGFTVKILTTETNFATRKLKMRLPNFGTFRDMGECVLVLAEK